MPPRLPTAPKSRHRLDPILKRPDVILFDWDDTLSDHRSKSIRTMAIVYDALGKKYEPTIPAKQILAEWYCKDSKWKNTYFPDVTYEQIEELYRETLYSIPIEDTKLFPKAKEMLAQLCDKGIKIGIVSNRQQESLEKEVDHLGMREFFGANVFGKRDGIAHKPSPDPIVNALKEICLPLKNVWMVGDSPEDAGAARSYGIQRFHIGDFLHDLVVKHIDSNDPSGRIIYCKDIGDFKERFVDTMPTKEINSTQSALKL